MKKFYSFLLLTLLAAAGISAKADLTVKFSDPENVNFVALGSEYMAKVDYSGGDLSWTSNENVYVAFNEGIEVDNVTINGTSYLTDDNVCYKSSSYTTGPELAAIVLYTNYIQDTFGDNTVVTISTKTSETSGGDEGGEGGDEGDDHEKTDTPVYQFICAYDALSFMVNGMTLTESGADAQVTYENGVYTIKEGIISVSNYGSVTINAKEGYKIDGITESDGTAVESYYGMWMIDSQIYDYNETFTVSVSQTSSESSYTYTFNCEQDVLTFANYTGGSIVPIENVTYNAGAYTMTGITSQSSIFYVYAAKSTGYELVNITGGGKTFAPSTQNGLNVAMSTIRPYDGLLEDTTFDVTVKPLEADENAIVYTFVLNEDVNLALEPATLQMTKDGMTYTVEGVNKGDNVTVTAEIRSSLYTVKTVTAQPEGGAITVENNTFSFNSADFNQDTEFTVTLTEVATAKKVTLRVISDNEYVAVANAYFTPGNEEITGLAVGSSQEVEVPENSSLVFEAGATDDNYFGYITNVLVNGASVLDEDELDSEMTSYTLAMSNIEAGSEIQFYLNAKQKTVTIGFSQPSQVASVINPNASQNSIVWQTGDSAPFNYAIANGTSLTVRPLQGYLIQSVMSSGKNLADEDTTFPTSADVDFSIEGLANGAMVLITTVPKPEMVFTFTTTPEVEEEILNITCSGTKAEFENGIYTLTPTQNGKVEVAVASDYASQYQITDISAPGFSTGQRGTYEIYASGFTTSTEFTVTLKDLTAGRTVSFIVNNESGMDAQYGTVKAFFTSDYANPFLTSWGMKEITVNDNNRMVVVQVGSNDDNFKSVVTSVTGVSVAEEQLNQDTITLDLTNSADQVMVNVSTLSGVNDIFRDENGNENVIYNLQGMRVNPDNVRSGLYIVNGRKILVK